jgi:hypothetical protein
MQLATAIHSLLHNALALDTAGILTAAFVLAALALVRSKLAS